MYSYNLREVTLSMNPLTEVIFLSPAKFFNYNNSTKGAKFSHFHSVFLGKALAQMKAILM